MQSHAVVEASDVVGDIGHRLRVVDVITLPDPLGLEAQEEALHHRLIPEVALAAHAAHQAMMLQQCLVQRAGVLAPRSE